MVGKNKEGRPDDVSRQDIETEEMTSDLLRALRRKKGFGLFFVQCNPAQAEKVVTAISKRFLEKRVEKFELSRQTKTLYGELAERYQSEKFDIACITGVEQALYDYEDTQRLGGWNSEKVYSYSWQGVPPLLSHLNRQREAFEASFPIALVFLVPGFVIDYFVQRAPDFFDWRSGFFKFSERPEELQQASQELMDRNYQEYFSLTPQQRIEKILELKDRVRQLQESECEQASSLLCEQGRLLESGGKYAQALGCYNRAVDLDPENYKALNSKGLSLKILQRYEEAIAAYDAAISLKPDCYQSWLNRGDVLSALDRHTESFESYNQVIGIKPDNYYAWASRGGALRSLKRHEEAIESYDYALEIKPDDYYAWDSRGDVLLSLERYEEAIESYNHALEIKPDYHYAWDSRGDALRSLERYEEAIGSYDHALEIKPDDYYAWAGKGFVYYMLDKLEECSKCLAEVVKIEPENKAAWNYQAFLSLAQSSYGSKRIFDKPLLIRQSQYWRVADNTSKVKLDRCRQSSEFLDKALDLDPNFVLAWANKSFPTYYLERYQEALQACNKALELEPNNESGMQEVIYTNRGYILLALNRADEALLSFTTALEIDCDLAEAWIGQGTTFSGLGQYAEAIDSFNQALRLGHPLAQPNLDQIQQSFPHSA